MQIITLVNQKGGVAKSTTATTLAHGLAIAGKKTLLVDLDGQGQSSTLLGLEQEPGVFDLLMADKRPDQVIRATGRDNLFIIPGNKYTLRAQILIAVEKLGMDFLQSRLKGVDYDYLIFDTPPSASDLTDQALYMSDFFIIPSATDFLSSEGVFKMIERIKDLESKNPGWRSKLLAVIPTFYDGVSKESQANIDELKKHFGDKVQEAIHRATILRECPAFGKTIFEYGKSSRAAEEYQRLVDFVLEATK